MRKIISALAIGMFVAILGTACKSSKHAGCESYGKMNTSNSELDISKK